MILGLMSILLAGLPALDDPPKGEPPAMEALWKDLEAGELEASRALLAMSARPAESVAFLRERMRPLRLDADRLDVLLVRLASKKEDVWRPAFEELEYFDPRLATGLEALMRDVTDSPARQRLVEVLSGRAAGSMEGKAIKLWKSTDGTYFNFQADNGSWWAESQVAKLKASDWGNPKKKWSRAVRALVLLEHIGTPEAVAIVREMAAGDPDAWPSVVASDALKRIGDGAR